MLQEQKVAGSDVLNVSGLGESSGSTLETIEFLTYKSISISLDHLYFVLYLIKEKS